MISGDVAQFMQDRETLSLIVATINVELNQAAKDTVAYLSILQLFSYENQHQKILNYRLKVVRLVLRLGAVQINWESGVTICLCQSTQSGGFG